MKEERHGLVLIAASLIVIALIGGFYLRSQRDVRREQNRSQGLSLARVLSSMPHESLIPRDGNQGALQVVKTSQTNPDFAYVALVSIGGQPLAQGAAPGVIVPSEPLPKGPALWMGERVIDAPGSGAVLEFFAPVLSEGEHVANLRVGFIEGGYGQLLEQASHVAMLALPIFLLTPLAYWLIRREVRPIAAACSQLQERVASESFLPVELPAGGQMGEFIHSFNRFVELAGERVRHVEARETNSLASSKVLNYQKSRLEAVLETLPDAVLLLDETGCVTFANGKLASILGVPPEESANKKPAEWCEDSEVVAFLANYEGPRPRLCRSDRIEFSPAAFPDNRVALSAHPLAGEGASVPRGTLATLRDITAESIDRRSQGEFVTHVAHELKSPLNVMAMYSESLLGKDGESEAFRIEACNVLQDEVERLSILVSTLLTIARIETGAVALDRGPVRLQEFLSDALDTVSRGKRDRFRFELDVPTGVPSLQIDKELLRVAINNLLTNAIKYNREGGEVTLSVDDEPEQIAIRVRDSGLGIAEADQRRIFEKFFRSDDAEVQARGGHGLGLSLAREIVDLHGGTLELESTPGEGSVFSILFRKTRALVGDGASA